MDPKPPLEETFTEDKLTGETFSGLDVSAALPQELAPIRRIFPPVILTQTHYSAVNDNLNPRTKQGHWLEAGGERPDIS